MPFWGVAQGDAIKRNRFSRAAARAPGRPFIRVRKVEQRFAVSHMPLTIREPIFSTNNVKNSCEIALARGLCVSAGFSLAKFSPAPAGWRSACLEEGDLGVLTLVPIYEIE
jgi:hypothetical protein